MKIDHVSAIVENGAAHIFAVLFNKLSVRLNDHVQPDIAAPCRRDHRNDIAERGQVAKLLKYDIILSKKYHLMIFVLRGSDPPCLSAVSSKVV